MNKIKQELIQLFTLKDSDRPWQGPVLTTISVGFPILIGFYLGNLSAALLASFSGLVILYLPNSGSFTNRITTLLISSFGFLVAFAFGQFFSFNHIVAIVVFGLFSMIVHLIILYYKTAAPRSFFFIMILSISITQPYNLSTIPTKMGLVALGTMFSSFLGLAFVLYKSLKSDSSQLNSPKPILNKNTYADYWEAIILGLFMSISLSLGYWYGKGNPYWIPISTLAVMQGASLYHIWQRSLHRIVGTFVGLGLCWLLLQTTTKIEVLGAYIILLQLIVELLIVRNYALAVIFITPMVIFLSEAANPLINSPNTLIEMRLWETIIGSSLGAFGGWILHKEKIRYTSIAGLKKIGKELKNTSPK